MPNFLEMLRLQNIFNPGAMMGNDLPSQGGITGNMPPPQGPMGGLNDMFRNGPNPFEMMGQPPTPDPNLPPEMPPQASGGRGMPVDVQGRMSEMYEPQTAANDRFEQLLGQYPQAQKPGWLRVIGATLADAYGRGPEAGQAVIEGGRQRQLADWKNQIGPAQQAANLERQENVNSRTLAYQTMSQTLRAEADAERARNNEVNAQIRQQRADAYEFKTRNPNLKLIITKGGNIMAMNPMTGETTDTGIPTGTLTEADKMSLTQENAIERIRETGGQQRQTEGVRQEGRQDIAETRGWQIFNVPDPANPGQTKAVKINQITGQVQDLATPTPGGVTRPSGVGTAARGEAPTQTRVRQFNNARQLTMDPELGKFIKIRGQNEFTVEEPGTSWTGSPTGPNADQHARIKAAIYGTELPIAQPGRTGAPGSDSTNPNPGAPAARTSVVADAPPQGAKPGGKWKQTRYGRVYVEP